MSINKKFLCIAASTLLIVSATAFAQSNTARGVKGNISASEDPIKPAATSEALALPPIISPTLDQIAEAQRVKQKAEIAKINAEAALVASAAKAAALATASAEKSAKASAASAAAAKKTPNKKLPLPLAIPAQTHRLLSVYKVKGKWKAEFVEGAELVTVESGQRFGNFVLNEISDSSVKLTSDKKGLFTAAIGDSF